MDKDIPTRTHVHTNINQMWINNIQTYFIFIFRADITGGGYTSLSL